VYKIVGADGVEYGPVDFLTLRTWAEHGRVAPATIVRDADSGQACVAGDMLALYPAFHPETDETPPARVPPENATEPSARKVQVPPRSHPPVLAVVLSLMPGLGQMYNKQLSKAVAILGITLLIALKTDPRVALVLLPFAAIDAGMIAARLNRGETVDEWEWF
jgi:hypothetical protein